MGCCFGCVNEWRWMIFPLYFTRWFEKRLQAFTAEWKAFYGLWRSKIILKAPLKIFQLLRTFSNQFHEKSSFDAIFSFHYKQNFIQFELLSHSTSIIAKFPISTSSIFLLLRLTMTMHKKNRRCTLHESLTIKDATIKLKKFSQITLGASFCSRAEDNMSFQFSRRWG